VEPQQNLQVINGGQKWYKEEQVLKHFLHITCVQVGTTVTISPKRRCMPTSYSSSNVLLVLVRCFKGAFKGNTERDSKCDQSPSVHLLPIQHDIWKGGGLLFFGNPEPICHPPVMTVEKASCWCWLDLSCSLSAFRCSDSRNDPLAPERDGPGAP